MVEKAEGQPGILERELPDGPRVPCRPRSGTQGNQLIEGLAIRVADRSEAAEIAGARDECSAHLTRLRDSARNDVPLESNEGRQQDSAPVEQVATSECVVPRSLLQAALWTEVRDRLERPALQLSGGQQQRLCIARCLAVEPDVVLMDEPASALDPTATARIEELILELKTRYTIVVVTHNMQQAARVSDRTAFMLNGELIEIGETRALFTRPGKKLTEDYITGRFG